jgi:predicted O-methyltransferase YrrM
LGDGAFILHSLVRALRPTTVVEIGTGRGRSTCAQALACRQNGKGKVFAIDPHTMNEWTDRGVASPNETFLRARLAQYGLNEWCEIIRSTTAEAAKSWKRSVDFLFIDGDHALEGVKLDFDTFRPWLTPDALVAFHDTAWEHREPWEAQKTSEQFPHMGVPEYMQRLQAEGYHSVTIPHVPGLTILDPQRGGFAFLAGRAKA